MLPDYLYPFIPESHQLWRSYPPLNGTTSKTVAREEVEKLFRDALKKKVTKYTGRLPSVHGHSASKPKLCYGSEAAVEHIGQWYIICAEPNCTKKYATWLEPAGILQHDLFNDEPLRSLLFMREELKPISTKDSTRAAAAKHSIERSPYYMSAFSDVYPRLASQIMKNPNQEVQNPYPTPPSASSSFKSGTLKNNQKRGLLADNITPTRTIKREREDSSSIIDLCKSDGEANEVPFHVILWTANNTDPSTFVLRSSTKDTFSLSNSKHHFISRGIQRCTLADLEVYDPHTATWSSLAWHAVRGPIAMGQTVLLRSISVSEMPDFQWMKAMASTL